MTTDVTARRFRPASPMTRGTVLGGLAALAVPRGHDPADAPVATIALAALPVVVDRRFNRARYDADRTVAAFAARLQDAVDPHTTRTDLLGTVHGALEPAHLSLWLREAER